MPSPGQPRLPLSAPLTRQQLDELEALMQRMLALPVEPAPDNAAESTASTAAKERQPAPLTDPLSPTNNPGEPQSGNDQPLVLPPPSQREGKGAKQGRNAVPPPPRSPSRDKEEGKELPQPGAGEPDGLSRTVYARKEPAPVRPGPGPLVWCNQVFDAWTKALGPPGRWLRGPQGRAVLGWIGVLLLAAALAWVVLDGMGWTW